MARSRKTYIVKVTPKAVDFIRRQRPRIQRQIRDKIDSLEKDPCRKGIQIKGAKGIFRIRSGNYRIAYIVEESRVLVLVIRIGHRKDFYRFFDR